MAEKEKRPSAKKPTSAKTGLNDKDMSAAAQCKRVLEHLEAGPQTTYSLRARGISHPAQRIKELIQLGYRIASGRVTAIDSDGFSHANVALYAVNDREPDLVDLMEAA
jgi:hypothetical protein